ncbi:toll/interleukin-1 receptor domain-containing protein [Coprococcus sp. AF16-5]|nr:toll/interleukin-1 receptor domain-containing protein [Coprococcus sp. AF16-5]RHR64587.1 toll/interleukin-1 receptor domain-containing protein [Coprococcus sp. AF16-5]
MKIFISHSSKDEDIYTNLADSLRKQGHTVFNAIDINIGENWIEKIKNALYESDIFIAIITENFLSSSWAQAELSSVVLGTNNIRLLPVVVGDVFVPSFIAQFQYRKVKTEEEIISAVLTDIAKLSNIEDNPSLFQKKGIAQVEENNLEEK